MKALLAFAFWLCAALSFSQIETEKMAELLKGRKASVGVAVLCRGKAFDLDGNGRYPLMSVFKFHVAAAALDKMEREGVSLGDMAHIPSGAMRKNTYSPLRDRHPEGQLSVSYGDLIAYAVSESDNNACDFLIGFAGGIGAVEAFVRSLGIGDFGLSETEHSMHVDIQKCYNNWSTPLAAVRLLEKVYTGNVLSREHFSFLESAMLNASPGKNKLKAGLPAGVKLGHKTGHSDRMPDGLQIAENDAGVIYLPGGEKCYIAVFVKDSMESDSENAKIAADIARFVYASLKNGPAEK